MSLGTVALKPMTKARGKPESFPVLVTEAVPLEPHFQEGRLLRLDKIRLDPHLPPEFEDTIWLAKTLEEDMEASRSIVPGSLVVRWGSLTAEEGIYGSSERAAQPIASHSVQFV